MFKPSTGIWKICIPNPNSKCVVSSVEVINWGVFKKSLMDNGNTKICSHNHTITYSSSVRSRDGSENLENVVKTVVFI